MLGSRSAMCMSLIDSESRNIYAFTATASQQLRCYAEYHPCLCGLACLALNARTGCKMASTSSKSKGSMQTQNYKWHVALAYCHQLIRQRFEKPASVGVMARASVSQSSPRLCRLLLLRTACVHRVIIDSSFFVSCEEKCKCMYASAGEPTVSKAVVRAASALSCMHAALEHRTGFCNCLF